MKETLTVALAQLNPHVGDIDGNIALIRDARRRAGSAELLVCSELITVGYPPEDLVLKPVFQDRIKSGVEELAALTADGGPAMLIGTPWKVEGKLYNAALLLDDGKVSAVQLKTDLPNYGVFDEKRIFAVGTDSTPIDFRGVKIGCLICEDMWQPETAANLAKDGAEILVVINGSPFEIEKSDKRRDLARLRVEETGLPLVYVNQVGGQDELVFDGGSFVLDNEAGQLIQMASWREDFEFTRWHKGKTGWTCEAGRLEAHPVGLEAMYNAMMVGLRDYVGKNGFPGVILGLSGGIDSALSAAAAVDALGADKVHCVMMPSPYTSQESLEDAEGCARLLGCKLESVSIEPAMEAFDQMLRPLFEDTESGVTEENIQSRSRGLLLMALSNKFGSMLLTTGNKSEMSVGYATLYGDMCGGYSVLKDVYKMQVFALCRWRNVHQPDDGLGPVGAVMPDRVISKPPSAELKPDQKDEDSLPPYEILDAVLEGLVEEERSVDDLVASGYDRAVVRRVWRLLDRTEYKRRQAPPGVKLTFRAFGRDRRYPITNGFTNLI